MNLVFVVGTGRCGSTLIHEILCKHEGFGFVSNIEDNLPWLNRMGRWNNALYRTRLGGYTRKGGLRFAPSEGYGIISREASQIFSNSSRDLVAGDVTPWLETRFRRFFELRNEAQDKPVFSHKYTGWPRIGFFQEIFPEARFIHIVRDGRAVANSWMQMPWWGGYRGPENWPWGALDAEHQKQWLDSGASFAVLAALGWKILMTSFLSAQTEVHAGNYLQIRYEDILAAPKPAFEQMLTFCGLDWTDAYDSHYSKQVFDSERKAAYLSDLTRNQLAEIENCIGELQTSLGYL